MKVRKLALAAFLGGLALAAYALFYLKGQPINGNTLARMLGWASGYPLLTAAIAVPWRKMQAIKTDTPIKAAACVVAALMVANLAGLS